MIRSIRNLLWKPVFEKGNADWLSELASVIKEYNNTIHNFTWLKPIKNFKKSNEKKVYSKLRDDRVKQKPKYERGQLLRTADIKRDFSKGGSTNWSYIFYTVTEVIVNTGRSYRINYLPQRFIQNLLLPRKLSLDEYNQNLKKLILIQKTGLNKWNKQKMKYLKI